MLRSVLATALLLVGCSRPSASPVSTPQPQVTETPTADARPTVLAQVRATAVVAAATANAVLPTPRATSTSMATATPTAMAIVFLGVAGFDVVPATSSQAVCEGLSAISEAERSRRITDLLIRGDVGAIPVNSLARLRSIGRTCAQVELVDGAIPPHTVWILNGAIHDSRLTLQEIAGY